MCVVAVANQLLSRFTLSLIAFVATGGCGILLLIVGSNVDVLFVREQCSGKKRAKRDVRIRFVKTYPIYFLFSLFAVDTIVLLTCVCFACLGCDK